MNVADSVVAAIMEMDGYTITIDDRAAMHLRDTVPSAKTQNKG